MQSSITCTVLTKAELQKHLGLGASKSNPLYDSDDSAGSEYGFADDVKFTREDAIAAATAIPGVPPQVIEAVAAVMYAVNKLSFSGQCLT